MSQFHRVMWAGLSSVALLVACQPKAGFPPIVGAASPTAGGQRGEIVVKVALPPSADRAVQAKLADITGMTIELDMPDQAKRSKDVALSEFVAPSPNFPNHRHASISFGTLPLTLGTATASLKAYQGLTLLGSATATASIRETFYEVEGVQLPLYYAELFTLSLVLPPDVVHVESDFLRPVMVSTFAGSGTLPGYANGDGASARFNSPAGVVADGEGWVYVADSLNNAIRMIDPAGTVHHLAGGLYEEDGLVDGDFTDARFSGPRALTVGLDGAIYVSDLHNHAIRKIVGTTVTTIAGNGEAGFANGSGPDARFKNPWGIVADSHHNLFVLDQGNLRIRKIAPDGTVSTFAGTGVAGTQDGPGNQATFDRYMLGMAIDGQDNLYVTDRKWVSASLSPNSTATQSIAAIRKITPEGVVSTLPLQFLPGYKEPLFFNAIAADVDGNLIVEANGRILLITKDAHHVSALAGAGWGRKDGPGDQATFDYPLGLSIGPDRAIYVADYGNHRIRKIVPVD